VPTSWAAASVTTVTVLCLAMAIAAPTASTTTTTQVATAAILPQRRRPGAAPRAAALRCAAGSSAAAAPGSVPVSGAEVTSHPRSSGPGMGPAASAAPRLTPGTKKQGLPPSDRLLSPSRSAPPTGPAPDATGLPHPGCYHGRVTVR